MRELQSGVWHWQAPHPGWEESEPWDRMVSSYAIDDAERLLVFDPIAPPPELDALAAEREALIVLTNPWHERDTRSLVDRLGLPVHSPLPDTQEDLMEKYGLTAERAAGGSPDLAWLLAGEAGELHPYRADGGLPPGVEAAFPGREANDVVLWIESQHAVVVGDTLVDFGHGLEIPLGWLRDGITREQIVAELRPLLELPVELVLPTHGTPMDRAALERALA